MKKLITSAIAATALLFGFASCSNGLHDVENTPYTNSANAVYVLGGISSSTMESAVKSTEADFDNTKSYKVALDSEGKAKFTFTYSGNDSWSAGAGNTAFAIVADVSKGWDGANAARWGTGTAGVAVGSEAALVGPTQNNAKITGLSAGTQYTVELALTAAGGTIKVTEGLAGVPFELIWVGDDNNLTNATSITSVNETTFSYDVAPEDKARDLKFIARYGNTYFVPAANGSFTVDGTAQEAAVTTSQPASVTNPLTVTIPSKADAGTVTSYRIFLNISASTATASVRKIYAAPTALRAINSSHGNYVIEWEKPEVSGGGSYNGKPYISTAKYTGTVTIPATATDGWVSGGDIQFGICTDIGDWGTKYTTATLTNENTEYSVENGNDNNNRIKNIETARAGKSVVIKITCTVYEGVYENGSYSDSFDASSLRVSYSLK